MITRLLLTTLALLSLLAGVAAAQPLDLSTAPVLYQGVRTYQLSSFDRSGANADGDSRWGFTRYDKATKLMTLFEAQGPGRIVRLWLTGWKDPTDLVLTRGSDAAYKQPVLALFDATKNSANAALVGDKTTSSGGFFTYVPWDFDAAFSVQAPRMVPPYYYQFTYRQYTDVAARERSLVGFAAQGKSQTAKGSPAEVKGMGLVQKVKVTLPAALATHAGVLDGAPLQTWKLQGWFDGEATPSIDASLSGFFGGTALGEPVAAAPVKVAVGTGAAASDLVLENNFPMPFAKGARFALVGPAGEKLAASLEVTWAPDARVAAGLASGELGTLKVRSTDSGPLVLGADATLLDVKGRSGKLVGVVLESVGTRTERFILEGDDRVFVDGARSPQLHGTGTEDFFNGGWYYEKGPYTRELAGNPAHLVDAQGDHTFQYRFLLPDAIPFGDSLRFAMEHGRTNEEAGTYRSTLFWYESPKPNAVLTDVFAAGDAAQASAHGFSAENSTPQDLEAVWLGSGSKATSHLAGVVSGNSRFLVALDPANQGALLRRTTDYSLANQSARVLVDGVFAGVWLSAGPGTSPGAMFADTEFLVPAAFTRGKAHVEVSLEPVGSWSAFAYEVFSLQ
ncbi:MAG: DUF2961 domain-containing protein [Spirochaetales bacterium]